MKRGKTAAGAGKRAKAKKSGNRDDLKLARGVAVRASKNAAPPITWEERLVSIDKLKPYEKNPRTISDEALLKLKEAIARVGYHNRVKCDTDYTIAGGHARIIALRELGHTEVKVLFPSRGLTRDEFRQIIIQDNLLFGVWDEVTLFSEFSVEELAGYGMDEKWLLSHVDPEDDEPEDGLCDPDHVPDEAREAVSKPGDVWLCGQHRVMCGNSCSADDVKKLMQMAQPNLMVTDPPYGVEYDANWRNEKERPNGSKITARAVGKVQNDDQADWREAWKHFKGSIAYVWHSGKFSSIVENSLTALDFSIRAQIIWVKQHFAISRGDYHWMHEACWYAVRGTGDWRGDRKQTTVWEVEHSKNETGHSTQKPVEVMLRPIKNCSGKGDFVYEPFLGSGTTLIAAQQMGRVCLGMEIVPIYVDVAVRRWQEFTGAEARLEGSEGTTFNSCKPKLLAEAKKQKKEKTNVPKAAA